MSTARLMALYRLGADYHSGQWSQGYRVHCRAATLLLRRGYRWPWGGGPHGYGPKDWRPSFRRHVARELRRFRHAFRRNG